MRFDFATSKKLWVQSSKSTPDARFRRFSLFWGNFWRKFLVWGLMPSGQNCYGPKLDFRDLPLHWVLLICLVNQGLCRCSVWQSKIVRDILIFTDYQTVGLAPLRQARKSKIGSDQR
jgi:hypothetical protein